MDDEKCPCENDIDLYKLVTKLVGPINPIADSHFDHERLENLKQLTDVVSKLVSDINDVAGYKNSEFGSMKVAGQYATRFFDELFFDKFGNEEDDN